MAEKTVEQSGRPAIVGKAVKILYATLGLGVLQAVLEFRTVAQQIPLIYILFVWAVVFGAMGFLIHAIGSRQNWARILWLFLFILVLPFSALPLLHFLFVTPLYGLIGLLQLVGQAVALAMLFLPASNAWFRKAKAS
jgi:hypothetical protein